MSICKHKQFICFAVLACILSPSTLLASNYEYFLSGWENGGSLGVNVEGNDLNQNGVLEFQVRDDNLNFSTEYVGVGLSFQNPRLSIDSNLVNELGYGWIGVDNEIYSPDAEFTEIVLDGTVLLEERGTKSNTYITAGGGSFPTTPNNPSGTVEFYANLSYLTENDSNIGQIIEATENFDAFNDAVFNSALYVDYSYSESLILSSRLAPVAGSHVAGLSRTLQYSHKYLDESYSFQDLEILDQTFSDLELVTSVEPGSDQNNPVLPTEVVTNDGVVTFNFLIDPSSVEDGEPFWIDPDIAVGYEYTVSEGLFASVTAPGLDVVNDRDGLYLLSFGDQSVDLFSGQTYEFADPVSTFKITGIDPLLNLDPADPLAFATGVSFASLTGNLISVNQSAITDTVASTPVPLPFSAVNLVFALAIPAVLRLNRKQSDCKKHK